jgi:hypothetical protein
VKETRKSKTGILGGNYPREVQRKRENLIRNIEKENNKQGCI